MKNIPAKITLMSVLFLVACSSQATKPIEVGSKLTVPADHAFVVPPEGIRFSNGATIGVEP